MSIHPPTERHIRSTTQPTQVIATIVNYTLLRSVPTNNVRYMLPTLPPVLMRRLVCGSWSCPTAYTGPRPDEAPSRAPNRATLVLGAP